MRTPWPLVVVGLIVSAADAQSLATDPLASERRTAISPNAGIRVESAAYAPGLVGGPASVPGEWIYAYPVFAVAEPLPAIDLWYVLGGFGQNPGINAAYGVPGGVSPILTGPDGFGPPGIGGIRAAFSPPLAAGAQSMVFYVSSFQGPYTGGASIPGNPPTFFDSIVGPIPSPGTGAALAIGLAAFGRQRRASRPNR